MSKSNDTVPREWRANRYRRFAQDAFQLASATAAHELRAGYLSLAARWHTLAMDLERVHNRQPGDGRAA